jgi:hypothetical protein
MPGQAYRLKWAFGRLDASHLQTVLPHTIPLQERYAMSTATEWRDTRDRFANYIDDLRRLMDQHGVRSSGALIAALRTNSSFRQEWQAVWRRAADQEGGKLSLTTAGVMLGALFGGVGIAAFGGAIGLPLAAVLGVGGLVAGAEFDALRRMRGKRPLILGIPRDLYTRLEQTAHTSGITVNELIGATLADAFPKDIDDMLKPQAPMQPPA